MKNGLIIHKNELRDPDRWEKVYEGPQEEIPWDIGKPSNELVETIKKIGPCFTLDVGCGTGTEAVYLAKNGFKVSAIDISETAIKIARERAKKEGVTIEFYVGDVLALPFTQNSFGFINDRGCFHTIGPQNRAKFVFEIARVLKPLGKYLMICFSDKEPETAKGPYRVSEREIVANFSEHFIIQQIKPIKILGKNITPHEGFLCLMKKK